MASPKTSGCRQLGSTSLSLCRERRGGGGEVTLLTERAVVESSRQGGFNVLLVLRVVSDHGHGGPQGAPPLSRAQGDAALSGPLE